MDKRKLIGYQIFPATFFDSNNDGWGDLKGITKKLDYISSLGVSFIYLNPVYKTSFVDSGYDVEDYYKIDSRFGNLSDMDLLIKEAKKRGMFIMMDLVLNHHSNNSFWFKEAMKSENNEYHEFFVWEKKPDLETNISIFRGPAWKYVEKFDKYYLHTFHESQPDLNWDNKAMREEFYKVVNFWIDKGIKGFRLDAIQFLGKDIKNWEIINGPKMKKILRELYSNTYEKHKDILVIGESYDVTDSIVKKLTVGKKKALDAYMNFGCMGHDWEGKFEKYNPVKKTVRGRDFKNIFNWQNRRFITINNNSNHDQARISDRYFGIEFLEESQKLFNLLLLSISGIPLFYNGEEFGMPNGRYESLEEFNDETIKIQQKALKMSDEKMLLGAQTGSRDLARTAFPWNAKNSEGVISKKSIFKESFMYQKYNAGNISSSVMKDFKFLTELRTNSEWTDVLCFGKYKRVKSKDPDVHIYKRSLNGKNIVIILNFSGKVFFFKKNIGKIIYSTKNSASILNGIDPISGVICEAR